MPVVFMFDIKIGYCKMQCYIEKASIPTVAFFVERQYSQKKGLWWPSLFYLSLQSWFMLRRQTDIWEGGFKVSGSWLLCIWAHDIARHLVLIDLNFPQPCSQLNSHLGLQVEFLVLWGEETNCSLWENRVSLPLGVSVSMISKMVILSWTPLGFGHRTWFGLVTPDPQSKLRGKFWVWMEVWPTTVTQLCESMGAHATSRQNRHTQQGAQIWVWGCWYPLGSREVLKASGQVHKKNSKGGLCRSLGDS